MKAKPNSKHLLILASLAQAYAMELETVQNYLANSIHLDGLHADVVKRALATDVPAELGHARALAERIKTLGGTVPGSLACKREQTYLQPPHRSQDVLAVVRGVVTAENAAIAHYQRLIRLCDGVDPVTQDLAIGILGSEEAHRREFMGFLN